MMMMVHAVCCAFCLSTYPRVFVVSKYVYHDTMGAIRSKVDWPSPALKNKKIQNRFFGSPT